MKNPLKLIKKKTENQKIFVLKFACPETTFYKELFKKILLIIIENKIYLKIEIYMQN